MLKGGFIVLMVVCLMLTGAIYFISYDISVKRVLLIEKIDQQIDERAEKLNDLEGKIADKAKQENDLFYRCNEIEKSIMDGGWTEFEATAYTINSPEQGTNNINALGWNLENDTYRQIPQIAVDPDIIGLNKLVEIIDVSGSKNDINVSGLYYTADTGGLIKGYRVDILAPNKDFAFKVARRDVLIKILDKGVFLAKELE
jgi:3D (Asp-Asp-Asp) domain-containing protein